MEQNNRGVVTTVCQQEIEKGKIIVRRPDG